MECLEGGIILHPNWYYDLYDEIFGWSRDYPKEITMINDIVSLKNKIVEEIGAGTGRHTEQILKMNPLKVEAIDCDIQAIDLLREKFKQVSNIQIIEGDGFIRGIETYGCDIFVECIDTNKHKAQGFTLIYESGQDYLGIKSEKTDFGVKIVYQGYINNMDVIYEVPICNCPLYLFEVNPNIKYEIIPLTQSGRKRILHLFK